MVSAGSIIDVYEIFYEPQTKIIFSVLFSDEYNNNYYYKCSFSLDLSLTY